jgi:hypothetical protein
VVLKPSLSWIFLIIVCHYFFKYCFKQFSILEHQLSVCLRYINSMFLMSLQFYMLNFQSSMGAILCFFMNLDRFGVFQTQVCRFFTDLVCVAEKSKVWLFSGGFAIIALIVLAKPILQILSVPSRMSIWRLVAWKHIALSMCWRSQPAVQTSIFILLSFPASCLRSFLPMLRPVVKSEFFLTFWRTSKFW